jgi:hypothetical protein
MTKSFDAIEEVLLLLEFHDSSAKSGVGEESGKVECRVARNARQHGLSFQTVWTRKLDRHDPNQFQ